MSFPERLFLWWVLVMLPSLGAVRVVFCGGAGCGEGDGAGLGAGLSCCTPRSSCSTFADRSRRGNVLRDNWVGAVFTICSLHHMKQAVRKKRKMSMSDVRG